MERQTTEFEPLIDTVGGDVGVEHEVASQAPARHRRGGSRSRGRTGARRTPRRRRATGHHICAVGPASRRAAASSVRTVGQRRGQQRRIRVGVAGQVAQRHIRRRLHRPGSRRSRRPSGVRRRRGAPAATRSSPGMSVPEPSGRRRLGTPSNSCGLRDDLGAMALEVHQACYLAAVDSAYLTRDRAPTHRTHRSCVNSGLWRSATTTSNTCAAAWNSRDRRSTPATSRSARSWSTATARRCYEDRNRVKDGDATQHPEFAIARWAAGQPEPGRARPRHRLHLRRTLPDVRGGTRLGRASAASSTPPRRPS